jgi:hypothetical protein
MSGKTAQLAAIEESGWGLPFRFFQPHNLAFLGLVGEVTAARRGDPVQRLEPGGPQPLDRGKQDGGRLGRHDAPLHVRHSPRSYPAFRTGAVARPSRTRERSDVSGR